MRRFLRTLIVTLMLTASFAGCFGDDGGDNDQPGPTETPPGTGNETNGNNNTTDPFAGAKFPPIPIFNISLEANGNEVTGSPFRVDWGSFVNVTFNAANSTDPDGEIRAYSWEVTSAAGFSGTSTNATFVADFGKMERQMFGVYRVVLKVLDDDSILNTTTSYFVINYHTVFRLPGGMSGVGTDDRNDPNEAQADEVEAGVNQGTYGLHRMTLGQNASQIDLELNYAGESPGTQMALYLFDNDVAEQDTNSAEPAASAGPGPAPVTISHGGNLSAGTWKVRVELDGLRVTGYTLDVVVTYAIPEE